MYGDTVSEIRPVLIISTTTQLAKIQVSALPKLGLLPENTGQWYYLMPSILTVSIFLFRLCQFTE